MIEITLDERQISQAIELWVNENHPYVEYKGVEMRANTSRFSAIAICEKKLDVSKTPS